MAENSRFSIFLHLGENLLRVKDSFSRYKRVRNDGQRLHLQRTT